LETNVVFLADDFKNLQAQRYLIFYKDGLDKFKCLRKIDASIPADEQPHLQPSCRIACFDKNG
jgi:hypothetical protein